MGVYRPGVFAYLRYDLEHVLDLIGVLYDVQIVDGQAVCEPLMRPPPGKYWAAQPSAEHFNSLMPKIKSLHMAMYAILEAVAKNELNKSSVTTAFEEQDPLFTPFRHLNNQFKHFGKKGVDIDIILLTHLIGKTDARIEPLCKVDGKLVPYQKFVIMFLTLLEKAGTIALAGKKPVV